MKGKRGLSIKRKLLVAVFVLLQMCIFVLPVQADWNDISGSINQSFSGDQFFSVKNILGFFLIAIIFALVAMIFRMSWLRDEKRYYQKRRNRVSLRQLEKQQNRYWFRLRTSTEFEWISAAGASKTKKHQYKKDKLVDLSGGGLCFTTREPLNPGDEILLLRLGMVSLPAMCL